MNPTSCLTRRIGAIALSVFVTGLMCAPHAVSAQSNEIDFNALITDTQRQAAEPDSLTLVWWLPEEFWRWALSQDGSLTPQGVEDFLAVVRPYVLLVVLDGTLGPLGGATFRGPTELRNAVVLVDSKGTRHKPLNDGDVSTDARNLADMMKPMLTNMMGPMGESLSFFFFPATTPGGDPIASAASEGAFSVEVGAQRFDWKTPLGSVLPAKVCPVDGQEMNGAWTYCPWHGDELRDKT